MFLPRRKSICGKRLGAPCRCTQALLRTHAKRRNGKTKRKFVVYRIDINDPLDSAVGRVEFPKFVSLTAADNTLLRYITCRFGSRALLFHRS